MNSDQKNAVLGTMVKLLDQRRQNILKENQKDVESFALQDQVLYDRLIVNHSKIDLMIQSLEDVLQKEDPIGKVLFKYNHDNGMYIENKTAPFGTILIIYESRPDVTIEAGSIAFKAGSRILLKGGKEAIHSNSILVKCWKDALHTNGLDDSWINYLNYSRKETQDFLKNSSVPLDLVVPRGGDQLIAFVKEHATCPVIVSGRGNNFIYIHEDADWDMAQHIVINAKTTKISACNSLDKVLLHHSWLKNKEKVLALQRELFSKDVEIISNIEFLNAKPWKDNHILYEEFLDLKILIDTKDSLKEAISTINIYSGGHSSCIITESKSAADFFMNGVDSAAVYHNSSTRFTDGGQFGLGAELAISTDKLHERGPLGLDHLVTNKWFIYGTGQIR